MCRKYGHTLKSIHLTLSRLVSKTSLWFTNNYHVIHGWFPVHYIPLRYIPQRLMSLFVGMCRDTPSRKRAHWDYIHYNM